MHNIILGKDYTLVSSQDDQRIYSKKSIVYGEIRCMIIEKSDSVQIFGMDDFILYILLKYVRREALPLVLKNKYSVGAYYLYRSRDFLLFFSLSICLIWIYNLIGWSIVTYELILIGLFTGLLTVSAILLHRYPKYKVNGIKYNYLDHIISNPRIKIK